MSNVIAKEIMNIFFILIFFCLKNAYITCYVFIIGSYGSDTKVIINNIYLSYY